MRYLGDNFTLTLENDKYIITGEVTMFKIDVDINDQMPILQDYFETVTAPIPTVYSFDGKFKEVDGVAYTIKEKKVTKQQVWVIKEITMPDRDINAINKARELVGAPKTATVTIKEFVTHDFDEWQWKLAFAWEEEV